MLASYHVIEDILRKWENHDELKNVFEKFAGRYPNDSELQDLFSEFEKYLKSKKRREEHLEEIKTRLIELSSMRKMDSSGGTDQLPYSDRRGEL